MHRITRRERGEAINVHGTRLAPLFVRPALRHSLAMPRRILSHRLAPPVAQTATAPTVTGPLRPLLLALVLPALGACLAGPSTALGGGPIGRAPDLREMSLLPEPDSTRGVGFILRGNRRDLVDQVRIDLNAAARAFERLVGERPREGDVDLVADEREVRVRIRLAGESVAPFTVSLQRDDRGRPRAPEALRVAQAVDLAMARAWITALSRTLAPGANHDEGWMAQRQVPAWLRVGLLQAVGGHRFHDFWLAQLARQRDSLPPLATVLSGEGCDDRCLASWRLDGDAPDGASALAQVAPPRRGRLPALEGNVRFAAMSFSVVQFIARREGPDYVRALVAGALSNGDVQAMLGSARSFTADPADIERQWRPWLAPFADPMR